MASRGWPRELGKGSMHRKSWHANCLKGIFGGKRFLLDVQSIIKRACGAPAKKRSTSQRWAPHPRRCFDPPACDPTRGQCAQSTYRRRARPPIDPAGPARYHALARAASRHRRQCQSRRNSWGPSGRRGTAARKGARMGRRARVSRDGRMVSLRGATHGINLLDRLVERHGLVDDELLVFDGRGLAGEKDELACDERRARTGGR